MFKHLPILCAAVLALAACGKDNGAPQAVAPTPAPAATAAATQQPPAAPSSAPATAATSDVAPAASASVAAAEPAPSAAPFVDNGKWIEGKHYFRIDPPQPTSHPGKIEVTEVFSYGCPACNAFGVAR